MYKHLRDRIVEFMRNNPGLSDRGSYSFTYGGGGCALCVAATVCTPELFAAGFRPYREDRGVLTGIVFGTNGFWGRPSSENAEGSFEQQLSPLGEVAAQALGTTQELLAALERDYMKHGDFLKAADWIEANMPITPYPAGHPMYQNPDDVACTDDTKPPAPISTEQLAGYLKQPVEA